MLRLHRAASTGASAVDPSVLEGQDLSVCLLDPLTATSSTRQFDIIVYVTISGHDTVSGILKLKLKFKSPAVDTLVRLLSSCFEQRAGPRLLAVLPSSTKTLPIPLVYQPVVLQGSRPSITSPPDASLFQSLISVLPESSFLKIGEVSLAAVEALAPQSSTAFVTTLPNSVAVQAYLVNIDSQWQSLVDNASGTRPPLPGLESNDPEALNRLVVKVVAIVRPIQEFLANFGESVPFVGPIASAVSGIFNTCMLVKARGSFVAKFVVIIGELTLKLTDVVSRGTLRDNPRWEPNGSVDLCDHLRQSFRLLSSLTKQKVMTKFLKANETISKLAEMGSKLLESLFAIGQDMGVKAAELQSEILERVTVTCDGMMTGNEAVMARIKELSSKSDAASVSNLSEIARLMEVRDEDFTACVSMTTGFEAMTAEIIKQFDKDVGPYRLIGNPIFRYIWKNSISGDCTSWKLFIASLRSYWECKRAVTGWSVGDGKDEVLSSASEESLRLAIDSDGDGKVS